MDSEGYGTMIIKSSNRFVDMGEQGGGQSDSKLWISRMAAILLLGAGVSDKTFNSASINMIWKKLPKNLVVAANCKENLKVA